jgi:hypothetical protein
MKFKVLVNGNTLNECLKNKREMMELEKVISNLKKNKKMYKRLIFLLALMIPQTTVFAFADSGIITVGMEVYTYIRDAVQVICLWGCAAEGTKCVVTGTIDQIGRVAIKYIAFALLIKFLPHFVFLIFSLGGKNIC